MNSFVKKLIFSILLGLVILAAPALPYKYQMDRCNQDVSMDISDVCMLVYVPFQGGFPFKFYYYSPFGLKPGFEPYYLLEFLGNPVNIPNVTVNNLFETNSLFYRITVSPLLPFFLDLTILATIIFEILYFIDNRKKVVKQKNFAPMIIVPTIAVLGIVVYFTYMFTYMNGYINLVVSKIASVLPFIPDPTASWKIYTNEEYGFSFKYPQDWEVNESTDDYFETKIIVNSFRLRLLHKAKYIEMDECVNVVKTSKIKIMNFPEYKSAMEFTGYSDGDCSDEVVERWLSAKLYTEKGYFLFNYQIASDFNDEEEKIFDQIVSTFEFVR